MIARKTLIWAAMWIGLTVHAWAAGHSIVQGMLLRVDRSGGTIMVSCDAIPGKMDAMVMTFAVREPVVVLKNLAPGTTVRFHTVERGNTEFAEDLRAVRVQSKGAEPIEAGALTALHHALDPASKANETPIGQPVPDFALTDQADHAVRLSEFRGKVVALTFAYSRCPNPSYCFRLSNNLAQLSRRFHGRAARDLVLITIVIDPDQDKGDALKKYANIWKADAAIWHFLTGSIVQVQQAAGLFGMNFWNDDGFLTHSFHTVVIDRQGRLAANLEGNQFTAAQLGDLVETVLRPDSSGCVSQVDALCSR